MKHIKIYENFDYSNIKVGDYAIFYYDDISQYAYHAKLNAERKDFINSHVGMIINVSNMENSWIEVMYDEIIPTYNSNKILLTKDVMIEYSKDKEKLEAKLSANKYNL